MGLDNWLKKQVAILSLALGGVEKNALGQKRDGLEKNITQEQSHMQGTVAYDLKQGNLTQEVMNLRWRMYKVLEESQHYKADIIFEKGEFDKENDDSMHDKEYSVSARKINSEKIISSIKLDSFDSYELEMSVDNSPITLGGGDVSEESMNLGMDTRERPIDVERETIPKFDIEKYTLKLNIRKIDDKEKLLEFYVSKYPTDDKRTVLFISDVKKAIENPRTSSILDIKGVRFISHKTVGAKDFHLYYYKITSFDKIIDFNGHYVIKFKGEVLVNGQYILEEFRQEELDKKYENKEKKTK